MGRLRRILFFGEPATLAHVVRPVVLAGTLDPNEFDIAVATGPDYRALIAEAGLVYRRLESIGTHAYLAAVSAGRPVFSFKVLAAYVEDDLRHIKEFAPDLVVGDFRLSLAVSARLAGVPYLAISNAYWSPYANVRFEVPVHALTRLLGPQAANVLFHAFRPLIFAHHSLPMHRLRQRHGMSSLGLGLRRVFTEGDVTLFADVPELVPTAECGRPGRYNYIGPITWSPGVPLPAELARSSDSRPLVYLNLGSSGDPALIKGIVRACTALGFRVALSTGSGAPIKDPTGAVVSAQALPGGEVAALAALVICNGGSPGAHQALQQGTPVLGIPSNLDQLLNMQFVTASGAGVSLRADRVTPERLGLLVLRLVNEPSYRENAGQVARWFQAYSVPQRFAEAITRALEPDSGQATTCGACPPR